MQLQARTLFFAGPSWPCSTNSSLPSWPCSTNSSLPSWPCSTNSSLPNHKSSRVGEVGKWGKRYAFLIRKFWRCKQWYGNSLASLPDTQPSPTPLTWKYAHAHTHFKTTSTYHFLLACAVLVAMGMHGVYHLTVYCYLSTYLSIYLSIYVCVYIISMYLYYISQLLSFAYSNSFPVVGLFTDVPGHSKVGNLQYKTLSY